MNAHRLIQRALSASFAALLTVCMLGGIDQLAQRDNGTAPWAEQAAQPTAPQAAQAAPSARA